MIGFYGTDGAQEGLEKSYDNVLSGVDGKQKVFKNAKQEIISRPIEIIETVQGEDVHLTIDATLQFLSFKYLVEAIKKNKKRIFEIDSKVMTNKTMIYASRSMIEENRLMILSNYAAAFMGNRQIAILMKFLKIDRLF